MPPSRKIKVGVIGCGFVGKIHIEALRRLGFIDVVALAERDQATAAAKAKELSVPQAYGDYQDLISCKEIDAVHICTTNNLHYPMAKASLAANKHVICEKPLAMSAAEAKELVALAQSRGVIHAVSHNMRYYPMVKQAQAMCANSSLGEIRLVHGHYLQDWLFKNTDYNWRLISELSGKSRAVADIGTHWFDMVQHVIGQDIVSVFADLTTFIPIRKKPRKEVETHTVVTDSSLDDLEDVAIDTEDHGTVLLRFWSAPAAKT